MSILALNSIFHGRIINESFCPNSGPRLTLLRPLVVHQEIKMAEIRGLRCIIGHLVMAAVLHL